jgi:hypothetical protein
MLRKTDTPLAPAGNRIPIPRSSSGTKTLLARHFRCMGVKLGVLTLQEKHIADSIPDEVNFSIDLIFQAALWPWVRLSL